MKRLYIIFSLALGTFALTAQNKDTERADKLFNRFEYLDAAAEYQKLVEDGRQDPYVYRQLAESHYNVFNSKEAVRWYAKATETDQDAETYWRYAQMLKAEGQYEAANAQMRKFAAKAPGDERAAIFLKDPDYLPRLRSQSRLFDAKSMELNSEKADFGAVLSGDGILYFASARNGAKRTYGWNEEPYLDLYQSVRNTDGTYAQPTPVSGVNSRWHDGPAAISSDGNTMYFSSESFLEKQYEKEKVGGDRQKRSQVYLFRATRNGSSWEKVTPLPFNGKDFSTGNASLSRDGKTLYFASNRPGSVGGTDIWKVSVNDDGGYGEPQNLGRGINTEGEENFPYITEGGRLYFASQGRKGFGGYDVFVSENGGTGEARNLGAPVNTNKDDFAFTFSEGNKIGFFSSNRDGNDNIYLATPVCSVELIATVRDAKSGAPLADAKVSILDDRRNVIETRQSDANGQVTYNVDCNKAFTIQASRDGYESGTFPVAASSGGTVPVAADLQPIETIVGPQAVTLNEIYFEYDRSNVTREGAFELDKLVQAMGKYPEMVIMVKSHTDSRGSDQYNMSLSERRAKSTVQYILSKGIKAERISGKGYGESEPKSPCTECTEEQHAQNRRSEFIIVKGAPQP